MDKINSIKADICRQIMELDVVQLETLTDAIDQGDIDGVINPPEVLTCSLCEKLYGVCSAENEECVRRYRMHLAV